MARDDLYLFDGAIYRDKSIQFNPALNSSKVGESRIPKTHDSLWGNFRWYGVSLTLANSAASQEGGAKTGKNQTPNIHLRLC